MAFKPMEEIAEVLNTAGVGAPVYVDKAPQGKNPPYVILEVIDPDLDRYFGGAIQRIDFHIKIYEVDYSGDVVDRCWSIHDSILAEIDEQPITDLSAGSEVFRLRPPRTNTDNDMFSIVQLFHLFFDEE